MTAICPQDNETLEQITRDVVRTHPDMQFFTGESEEAELHRQVCVEGGTASGWLCASRGGRGWEH